MHSLLSILKPRLDHLYPTQWIIVWFEDKVLYQYNFKKYFEPRGGRIPDLETVSTGDRVYDWIFEVKLRGQRREKQRSQYKQVQEVG